MKSASSSVSALLSSAASHVCSERTASFLRPFDCRFFWGFGEVFADLAMSGCEMQSRSKLKFAIRVSLIIQKSECFLQVLSLARKECRYPLTEWKRQISSSVSVMDPTSNSVEGLRSAGSPVSVSRVSRDCLGAYIDNSVLSMIRCCQS